MKDKLFYLLYPLIILTNLFQTINSQTDKSYLYKYNQLYSAKKFTNNQEFTYKNYTSNFICNDAKFDCSGNGICTTDKKTCNCNSGYTSIFNSYVKCSYKQKSNLVALLLELIGFGFGHLYIQNYAYFIVKFLFFFFACYCNIFIAIFVGALNNSNVDPATHLKSKRLLFLFVPIMVIWYFVDIIIYIKGGFLDKNNMDLA